MDKRNLPLYCQVANDISSHIASGDWSSGTRLPSERSLCERYGVSQITVRRALRESAHLGLVESRHGLGWFVCAAPAASTDQQVTVIVQELDWLTALFLQELAAALRPLALRLHVDLCCDGASWAQEMSQQAGAVAVGLIPASATQGAVVVATQDAARAPAAYLVRNGGDEGLPCAVLDGAGASARATQHLLSLGHRRLAYLGESPDQHFGLLCYQGFAQSLWDLGVELPLDWVFAWPMNTDDDLARFERVFSGHWRPTALVCSSDLAAAQAMAHLDHLAIRCPEQVAIVGLGNRDFCPHLPTPLTTFAYDVRELASRSAKLLHDQAQGQPPHNVLVSGQVIVRASCGANINLGTTRS
jgi:DNA-binding LacI/PurR family transcriptional regulator